MAAKARIPQPESEECVECGKVDEWNFAVRDEAGHVTWLCQKHGQNLLDGEEPI